MVAQNKCGESGSYKVRWCDHWCGWMEHLTHWRSYKNINPSDIKDFRSQLESFPRGWELKGIWGQQCPGDQNWQRQRSNQTK